MSSASSWSAENNSAKRNFKTAVFIIFPELYVDKWIKKEKETETCRSPAHPGAVAGTGLARRPVWTLYLLCVWGTAGPRLSGSLVQ